MRMLPLLVVAIVLLPELAAACSVCTTGSSESAGTFLAMTIFMTTLPFAAVGAVIFFLRRRFRAIEAEREARATQAAPTAAIVTPR